MSSINTTLSRNTTTTTTKGPKDGLTSTQAMALVATPVLLSLPWIGYKLFKEYLRKKQIRDALRLVERGPVSDHNHWLFMALNHASLTESLKPAESQENMISGAVAPAGAV